VFTGVEEEIDDLENDTDYDVAGPPQSVYTSDADDALVSSFDYDSGFLTEETDHGELEQDELEDDANELQVTMNIDPIEATENTGISDESDDEDWGETVKRKSTQTFVTCFASSKRLSHHIYPHSSKN
jgi:hypothetical protein